jgi:ComEC/Rec2-related protein
MRSIVLAFACIVSVACGSLIARFGAATLLGPLLALALVVVVGLVAWVRRERSEHVVLVVLLACTGLVRGAAAEAPERARVLDRGLSAELRVFEVVGASEPGPRCTIVLREAGVSSAPITVSAPSEACPCWRGQRLALASSALRPSWKAALGDDDPFGAGGPDIELGEGAVMWRRAATRSWFERPLDGYWRAVAQLRQVGWESSRGDAAASMVVAVGLGLRSALAPEQREDLRASGLGHLIAVSGLNVAIAAVWLQFLARRSATMIGGLSGLGGLGISPGRACMIAWLPLWSYVGLTGAAASAIRAATMLTVVDLGTVVGRPTHGPTTLAIVAAAMLLWQPQWLLDPGFALSIAAMAVIVSVPHELGLLATSWRISWVTAPLSVLYFDVAPLHGLLGNAIALPLFALLMPVALVACVVPGGLGEFALLLGRLFATPILDAAQLLARVPAVGTLGLLLAGVLGAGVWLLRPGPRLAAWLPPKLACALAIALSGFLLIDGARSNREAADSFDWIAMGTAHSRSLLVVDRSGASSACLYRPTNSTATWRWLLAQHGVSRIGRLDARLPDADAEQEVRSDPRTRALAVELRRAGVEIVEGEGDCRVPTAEQVRGVLRECRYLQGGRGEALARVSAGILSCRIEDRWVEVEGAD